MIIQVIPAKRMPLSLPWLDYLVPEKDEKKIKPGQLVKIPFRNKEEFGVVLSIKPITLPGEALAKPGKLKSINEIVFAEPMLSVQQLNFLKEISDFYHVSLGFLLKGNLIPLQKRKLSREAGSRFAGKKILPNKPDLPGVVPRSGTKPGVFIYKNKEEKKQIIIKNIQIKNGQTLFLAPELASIQKIQDLLPKNILNKTVAITSELSNKELFEKWLQIWSGEKSIVIGTRTALFLPWFNLKNIIMDDEANPNYKSWDMSPRLHTRDAALFLSKSHSAKLTLLSHTPSVETYYFSKNKVYLGENTLFKPTNKTMETIDMRAERRSGNYSLFSRELFNQFKTITTGDIFLFLNRRGSSSYVGCRDCGNVLKCPNCKLALNYHQDTNVLTCHYCHRRGGVPPHGGDKFSEPMPQTCKICHGTNVAMYGAGTQLAEELVKKILDKNDTPDSAKASTGKRAVIRIDSDIKNPVKQDSAGDKIIIGTQLAWPYIKWERIKLFAFLDADASLFIPEYKIIENLWQQLRDALFNMPDDAKLFIQTSHPDHLVFQSLFNPDDFYAQQLAERRALGYPPFRFLVKLLLGNPKAEIVTKEATRVHAELSDLTKNHSDITILGPLETSPYRYGGQYWQVILAKIKYGAYKQSTKLLLSKVPDNWKIDPNPNSLLYFS